MNVNKIYLSPLYEKKNQSRREKVQIRKDFWCVKKFTPSVKTGGKGINVYCIFNFEKKKVFWHNGNF